VGDSEGWRKHLDAGLAGADGNDIRVALELAKFLAEHCATNLPTLVERRFIHFFSSNDRTFDLTFDL